MSAETDDVGHVKQETGNGALFAIPFDSDKSVTDLKEELSTKSEAPGKASTPDPTDNGDTQSGRRGAQDAGGPIRRVNDIVDKLGSVGLEKLGLDGSEVAKAVAKRTDEIYRNEFPIITPRFKAICEHCGAEHDNHPGDEDDQIPSCPECDEDALREIDESERAKLKNLIQSVNREGQSFRELAKYCEDDHSRLGVGAFAVKWNYTVAREDVDLLGQRVADRGAVVSREFDELVRADPKRVVPVVDENGRIGNYWWACPIHRAGTNAEDDAKTHVSRSPGQCKYCGTDLREAWYVELDGAMGRRSAKKDISKYYFKDEMVMWAHHIPRLNGLDGVSPIHLVWLQQAVLHWMDRYAAEYFNPNSGQTPNKFVIIHTTNSERFEKQLDQAKEDQSESPYNDGILYNEISAQMSAKTDAQVIDTMGDEFLGQSQEIRSNYESQIRSVFGLSDIHDSDTEGAGGLNNEGLQLEVTDRSIAAAQQELVGGPFRQFLNILGFDDWKFRFVPHRESDLEERKTQLEILQKAAELGLPAHMEDGEAVVGDGEASAPQPDAPFPSESGSGAPPGQQQPGAGPSPPRTPTAPNQSAQTDDVDAGLDQHADRDPDVEDDPLAVLEAAFKYIVWDDLDDDRVTTATGGTLDVSQKARQPFWSGESDLPQFVQRNVEKALNTGTVWSGDTAGDATPSELRRFFEHQLSQPEGWSLQSVAENYADRFDTTVEEAEPIARSETAAVLNKAREIGYQRRHDPSAKYYWQGPDDDGTTEACERLKEQTNPNYGGTPVGLDELKELVRQASEEYFPSTDTREWCCHINERHTFVRDI